MDLGLKGKGALITGGASGIGEATAKLFANEGVKVGIVDIDEKNTYRVVEEIKNKGGEAEYFSTDLQSRESVKDSVDQAYKFFNGIDILVNNAALYAHGDILEVEPEQVEKMIAVNINGVLWMSRYVSESMVSGGINGSIINVASEAALVGIKKQVIYNLTKAAVVSITQSCAIDLAPYGIRVNCVCPGTTFTPLVEHALSKEDKPEEIRKRLENSRPLNRLGRPEEIAFAILMLACESLGYATGSIFSVDGGYTAW